MSAQRDEYLARRTQRCTDCDLNGFLDVMGRVKPSHRGRVRRCRNCGGRGEIRLITKYDMAVASAGTRGHFVKLLTTGGGRLATYTETIDPMLRRA